ncbi:MAG: SDR family NAD(P)-dependent oxidoreductase, partial [Bdellovibrionales bacterium]
LYLTRKVLPGMIESGRGHIVNLGSVAGRWVYPGGGVYCATKFAVRALSEGLRMDLLGTPIRVTNIEPGMVETEFSQVRFGSKEKAEAVYRGMRPLYPQDIAETILWCLTRPPHVNVQELVLFPTDQAAVHLVHRESPLGRA